MKAKEMRNLLEAVDARCVAFETCGHEVKTLVVRDADTEAVESALEWAGMATEKSAWDGFGDKVVEGATQFKMEAQ